MSEASAALREKLWVAFPPLLGEAFVDIGDDPVTQRRNLSLFSPEDLKGVMGKVLIELLESSDRTDAVLVIRLLDVPMFQTEESRAALAEGLQSKGLRGDRVFPVKRANDHLRAWKAQTFSTFAPVQASAIEDWLRAVQDWPELAFIYNDVQSALGYWANRARE